MTWRNVSRNPDRNPAKKVTVNGVVCDSKMEGDRWLQLSMMELAGEIRNLKHHPRFPLEIPPVPWLGDGRILPLRVAIYEADAEYEIRHASSGQMTTIWHRVVEDTKGRRPEPADPARGKKAVGGGPSWSMFRLKAKLVKALYGIDVQIWPPMAEKPRRPHARTAKA